MIKKASGDKIVIALLYLRIHADCMSIPPNFIRHSFCPLIPTSNAHELLIRKQLKLPASDGKINNRRMLDVK